MAVWPHRFDDLPRRGVRLNERSRSETVALRAVRAHGNAFCQIPAVASADMLGPARSASDHGPIRLRRYQRKSVISMTLARACRQIWLIASRSRERPRRSGRQRCTALTIRKPNSPFATISSVTFRSMHRQTRTFIDRRCLVERDQGHLDHGLALAAASDHEIEPAGQPSWRRPYRDVSRMANVAIRRTEAIDAGCFTRRSGRSARHFRAAIDRVLDTAQAQIAPTRHDRVTPRLSDTRTGTR